MSACAVWFLFKASSINTLSGGLFLQPSCSCPGVTEGARLFYFILPVTKLHDGIIITYEGFWNDAALSGMKMPSCSSIVGISFKKKHIHWNQKACENTIEKFNFSWWNLTLQIQEQIENKRCGDDSFYSEEKKNSNKRKNNSSPQNICHSVFLIRHLPKIVCHFCSHCGHSKIYLMISWNNMVSS